MQVLPDRGRVRLYRASAAGTGRGRGAVSRAAHRRDPVFPRPGGLRGTEDTRSCRRCLAARRTTIQIRVWVAGCATGEEVYSIAILFSEVHRRPATASADITIFGTDIDAKAIAIARAGALSARLDGLIARARSSTGLSRTATTIVPVAAIRDMCIFSEHSLVKDPPFSKLDLVSCRNVLIYLDNDLQERVMQTFHYALLPGGYLFLGPSESVSRAVAVVRRRSTRSTASCNGIPTPNATLPEFQPSPPAAGGDTAAAGSREDRIDKGARRRHGQALAGLFCHRPAPRHPPFLRRRDRPLSRALAGAAQRSICSPSCAKTLRSQVAARGREAHSPPVKRSSMRT